MKKTAFCVFGLTLWMLALCTVLSVKIEALMTAEVVVFRPPDTGSYIQVLLPIDVLFCEDGQEHVYTVMPASSWKKGNQIMELDSENFSVDYEWKRITAAYSEKYVLYSTKPLCAGSFVQSQNKESYADDCYLALYDGGAPALKQSRQGLVLEAQTQDALLLSAKQVEHPFMEKQVWEKLAKIEDLSDYQGAVEWNGAKKRVYSLSDLELFLKNLPLVAVLLSFILLSSALLICSCLLVRDVPGNRKRLLANLILIVLLTIGIPVVVNAIHLPASLLPRRNILEWSHYTQELRQILGALNRLPSSVPMVQTLLASARQTRFLVMGILSAGLFFTGATAAAELYAARRSRQGTESSDNE